MTRIAPKPVFEIVPGFSVGPVRLGMTSAEVTDLGDRAPKEIQATFDESGICRRITARVGTHVLELPRFSLDGRVLNGLAAEGVDAIFASLATDVHHERVSTAAPSIGLFAVKWDRLECYAWLGVARPWDARDGASKPPGEPEPITLDVVPGRSIGPVLLGMTRAEFQAVESGCPQIVPHFEHGRCYEIEAHVPWEPGEPPFFRVGGQELNGLLAGEVDALLARLYGGAERSWGGVELPSAGISAGKWEHIDEHYYCVTVFAARAR